MSDNSLLREAAGSKKAIVLSAEIQTELFRKSIHILVALVPAMASLNIIFTQLFLAGSVLLYSTSELMRMNGRQVLLISGITAAASRNYSEDRFELGPVTLAVGAMLALMLYPSTAAAIAIYALAFGDSAASIAGKFFGRIVIVREGKKTLEGSLACFAAVFMVAVAFSADFYQALFIAAAATVIELISVRDIDNLLIPIVTGLAAVLVL
jgi:dolichol kinase